MKLPLLIILVCASLFTVAQKPAKSLKHDSTHVNPPKISKDSAVKSAEPAASAPAPLNPSTPCYLVMPRYQWYQLVQLLDNSEGGHNEVKALINYIQTNAKELPPSRPDTLAVKPKQP